MVGSAHSVLKAVGTRRRAFGPILVAARSREAAWAQGFLARWDRPAGGGTGLLLSRVLGARGPGAWLAVAGGGGALEPPCQFLGVGWGWVCGCPVSGFPRAVPILPEELERGLAPSRCSWPAVVVSHQLPRGAGWVPVSAPGRCRALELGFLEKLVLRRRHVMGNRLFLSSCCGQPGREGKGSVV